MDMGLSLIVKYWVLKNQTLEDLLIKDGRIIRNDLIVSGFELNDGKNINYAGYQNFVSLYRYFISTI